MAKHKILVQGNYGNAGKLTKECIEFIESKGKKYPDIMKCRHDLVLIEMFDKFAVQKNGYKVLYTEPTSSYGNGYYFIDETDEDTYCIVDYCQRKYINY